AGVNAAGHAFTGREWDVTAQLHYYRARYYDSSVGRFLSPDPIEFLGGTNFYRYVGDNPVNWRDPLGLEPGRLYRTKNAAAKAAMGDIFDPHRRTELCGNICRVDADHVTYDAATNLHKPEYRRATHCDPPPTCSNGTDPVGFYHSHQPSGDPTIDRMFSNDDN